MDGNGDTTIFFTVMIWNHPLETTIKKWLFGVPGLYNEPCVFHYFHPIKNHGLGYQVDWLNWVHLSNEQKHLVVLRIHRGWKTTQLCDRFQWKIVIRIPIRNEPGFQWLKCTASRCRLVDPSCMGLWWLNFSGNKMIHLMFKPNLIGSIYFQPKQ